MCRIKYSLLMIFVFVAFERTSAQTFEGVITATITYTKLPSQLKEMEELLPKEITFYAKNGNVKIQQLNMGNDQIVIYYDSLNEAHTLLNVGDEKVDVVFKNATEDYDHYVSYTTSSKTKIIAGIECLSTQVTDRHGNTYMVYYTDQINIWHKDVYGLEGFPMAYTKFVGDVEMVITVNSVDETDVEDEEFDISTDYLILTEDEFDEKVRKGLR